MTTKYAAYRPAASDHTKSPFISGEVESYTPHVSECDQRLRLISTDPFRRVNSWSIDGRGPCLGPSLISDNGSYRVICLRVVEVDHNGKPIVLSHKAAG